MLRRCRKKVWFGVGALSLFFALATAFADCRDIACFDCARVESFRYCKFVFRKGYCDCWAGRNEDGGSYCVAGGGTCHIVKW